VNRLQTYLNSEGSQYTIRTPQMELRVTAETEAADGRRQSDHVTVFVRRVQDLPSAAALAPQIHALQDQLERLATAPLPERYEGPVLFEGQAAGELFITRFAANVAVTPAIVQGHGLPISEMSQQGSRLLRRIGFKVLPEFLDVADDPTLTQVAGTALMGSYKVDKEGVPARHTLLVQSGVLKTVLTSRAPVEGITASSGNLRERGVAASNLLVSSQKGATAEELRRQLVQLAQSQGAAYGIVIRRLQGDTATVAYRLYPDGHEELLRDASLEGLDVTALSRIAAVSRDSQVYTRAAPQGRFTALLNPLANPGAGFAGNESTLVSCTVPSLLVTDVTIDKPRGQSPKPALISSPLEASR
jgi:predicted Zn-dependent protease